MFTRHFVLLLFPVVAACSDRSSFEPSPVSPRANISDAVHSRGNPHFYFLAPLVRQPGYTGNFDGSLPVSVEICMLSGSTCGSTPVAVFTTVSGPGGERVQPNESTQSYQVNWHTDRFALDPTRTYRINVRAAGTLLGFADVILLAGGQARNAVSGDFVELINGRTLPIRFRVERGAVYVVEPPATGAPPAIITTTDGVVQLRVPAGALTAPTGITVEPISLQIGADETIVAGTAFEFGPDGTQFDVPVSVTFKYDPSRLPVNRKPASLRLAQYVNGKLVVVPGSHVDVAASTVTAPLSHFSAYVIVSLRRLAFTLTDGANTDLVISFSDGQIESVLPCIGPGWGVQWSPDGHRVAAYCSIGKLGIYNANQIGQYGEPELERFIEGAGFRVDGNTMEASSFDWSPDGTKLVFDRAASASCCIATVPVDGTALPTIIPTPGLVYTGTPSWSPDGTKIVFDGWTPTDEGGIHMMNSDGSNLVRLTNSSDVEWHHSPVWIKGTNTVVFANKLDWINPLPPYRYHIQSVDVNTREVHTLRSGINNNLQPFLMYISQQSANGITFSSFGTGSFQSGISTTMVSHVPGAQFEHDHAGIWHLSLDGTSFERIMSSTAVGQQLQERFIFSQAHGYNSGSWMRIIGRVAWEPTPTP